MNDIDSAPQLFGMGIMKRSVSFQTVYIALVRRLHMLVLLSCLVPCFCQVIASGMSAQDAEAAFACFLPLYGMTLTLAVPAAFAYLLQEKVKTLGVFLLCALPVSWLFLAGLFALEKHLGLSVMGCEQVTQALILITFLLDAVRMRTNDNSRKRAKAQEDHSWTGDMYLLPLPSLAILAPFAVLYVCALFFHSNELAQTALTGSILYFFLVLPYHVLVRNQEYLESRHHVSRIPVKQISRLQRSSLLRVMIPCALLAAAALLTAGGRQFLDLPSLGLDLFRKPEYGVSYDQNALIRELIALGYLKRGAPPPRWLIALLDFIDNALTIFLTGLIFYGIWLIIRSVIIRFRRQYEEQKPKIAAGGGLDEHVSLKPPRTAAVRNRQGAGIRRRYRRIILRFRGGPPDPYESPSLMEERAGLPDTEPMHRLHDEYEKARYG